MEYSLKIHHWLILVNSLVVGLTLVFSGCEGGGEAVSYHTDHEISSTGPVITDPVSTNTISAVLNDDPNCELVLKYQSRAIENDGQVHYVNRVLTSDPFDSANPVCVQYNDTRTGEVTVWKDLRSTGRRINKLPSDRGIDKIVVFYE